jgi:hypothetical protein
MEPAAELQPRIGGAVWLPLPLPETAKLLDATQLHPEVTAGTSRGAGSSELITCRHPLLHQLYNGWCLVRNASLPPWCDVPCKAVLQGASGHSAASGMAAWCRGHTHPQVAMCHGGRGEQVNKPHKCMEPKCTPGRGHTLGVCVDSGQRQQHHQGCTEHTAGYTSSGHCCKVEQG